MDYLGCYNKTLKKGGLVMDVVEALKKRKEREANIIAKALIDDEFRKALLSDPRATLEKESGQKLPDNLKLKVIEEDPDTIIISLPQKPKEMGEKGELSEEALENVAGGLAIGLVLLS